MNKKHIFLLALCAMACVGLGIEHGYEPVIMSPEQIRQYNRELVAQGDLHMVDILKQTDTAGMHNIYGLTVRPTDVRTIPTCEIKTKDGVVSGPFCIDEYQETQLLIGEGVVILEESADSLWWLVQASNYRGWVEKRNIVLCSYEEMKAFLTREPFAVTLTLSQENILGETMRINMGTRLPKGEKGVLVPCSEGGRLHIKEVVLSHETYKGYLPYTWQNIKRLAYRQEGSEYGWGNRDGFNDCTGFVQSLYRCVGIYLPRNSSDMRRIRRHNFAFDHQVQSLKQYPAGSILLTPSHAMLLLDSKKEPRIIHCFTKRYDREHQQWIKVGKTQETGVADYYYDNESLCDRMTNVVVIK